MKASGVILAAGLGTRMKSRLPKVLHEIHGLPMLQYAIDSLRGLNPEKTVIIVGKHRREIEEAINAGQGMCFAEQKEPNGTANALLTALPSLKDARGTVVVVNGDTPLVTSGTLKRFLSFHRKKKNDLSVLSFVAENPSSYGRIVRDGGRVSAIVEDRDADPLQKAIKEVNSGVYCFEQVSLNLLKKISMNKAKGEYYLTDIVSIGREKGLKIGAFCVGCEEEFIGVNTREELEKARCLMKDRIIRHWAGLGVDFKDSRSVFLSSRCAIGSESILYPNVYLEGRTTVGRNCTIYPNVRIVNSIIEDGAVVKDSCVIEDSKVKKGASVGPFAHIRPGSEIGEEARIGNFVEVKKSVIGSGTKASHLSYLGDARIEGGVNIGAGTITCNYDGREKHVTTIEEGVFIGSDSQLVAPVTIGRGAYVGAGSTITQDVPSNALALSRTRQVNLEGWALKRKRKKVGSKK